MAMDLTSQFALDMQGVSRLKYTAQQDAGGSLKQAARQFEAVFLQMMLKSMRDAVPQSGLLDSNQTKMYTSMMDQQWAQELSKRGIGIADMMVKQLQGKGLDTSAVDSQGAVADDPADATAQDASAARDVATLMDSSGRIIPSATPARVPFAAEMNEAADKVDSVLGAGATPASSAAHGWQAAQQRVLNTAANMLDSAELPAHVSAFLDRMTPAAQAVSEKTGIPSRLILAQAALETGWGAKEIVASDGSRSHNLFNIKSTGGWSGRSAEVTTTEYEEGSAQRIKDSFRVYDSYEQAFSDYARLLTENPRYAGVVAAGTPEAAAHQLQRSGYATDPNYGDKLVAIMAKIPDTLARVARTMTDNGYADALNGAHAVASTSRDASDDRPDYSIDNAPTQIF